MRVMYLSASAELGGAERSLLDILASIRQAEREWVLHFVCAADGPLTEQVAALGVSIEAIPFGAELSRFGETGGSGVLGSRFWRALPPAARWIRRLRNAIAAFGPHVVHSNSVKTHLLACRAVPASAALVWHLHDYIGTRPLTARVLRWHSAACAAAVAISESVASDARRTLGPTVPIVTVLNGVDLKRFSSAGGRLDLDRLAGLPPAGAGVVRVGLVATFGRWKGHTTFLDALARLPNDLRVRAYIVGGALYETLGSQYTLDELRRYAGALGLRDRVGFTGFVNRPEEALRALDIVVHASTAPEPFGLVIAEAMACERAVIASDAGGAREIFTPGIDALGHTPGSADSLAARIAELARDRDARLRIGRAGRETAERRFDRSRLAADLLPVYQRALAHA